jgi:hypothetical protein
MSALAPALSLFIEVDEPACISGHGFLIHCRCRYYIL